MPRHTNKRRSRSYRTWLERKAEERREALRELECTLHAEWREQQTDGAVDTTPVDGERLLNPLTHL